MRTAPTSFDSDQFTVVVFLITQSGSRYTVGHHCTGSWWFCGQNAPNPLSCALPVQLWRITRPTTWPPQLGTHIAMMAPPDLALDDPDRVPGGGKVTSPISVVRTLVPAQQ